MSGRKETYTFIADTELEDLRRRAAEASDLRTSNALLNRLHTRNQAAIREYEARMNEMNTKIGDLNRSMEKQGAAAKKETQALRTQLQNTVRASNERLQEMARQNEQNLSRMQNDFTNALVRTREDFARTISENTSRLEAKMEENKQQLRREIEAVRAQVDATAKDQQTLLEMAAEYASMAQTLNRDTKENYRAELLCPGRLQEAAHQLAVAEENIRDARRMPANAATARFAARTAMETALQLHQDVIEAEQEWYLHYQAAKQVLDAAELRIEASRRLEIPEKDGTPTVVDVNFWTDGDLARMENRLRGLHDRVDMPDAMARDLDNIQNAGVQLTREIDNTAIFATEALYCSQDRADVAADIAQTMESALGLQVVDHSYCGNDWRSAHRIHLKNPQTQFEMVVTQTPEKNDEGQIGNHLESDILCYGTNNQELGDSIARNALEALHELGFTPAPVTTVSGYATRESDRVQCRNMKEWETEQAPAVLTSRGTKPRNLTRKPQRNA